MHPRPSRNAQEDDPDRQRPRRSHEQPPRPLGRGPARRPDGRRHGVSGSGKSSLAFDTLYAEGLAPLRRELLRFARQFLRRRLEATGRKTVLNVPPAIAMQPEADRLATAARPSGTLAQLLEPLRVLYATLAVLHCERLSASPCARTIRRSVAGTRRGSRASREARVSRSPTPGRASRLRGSSGGEGPPGRGFTARDRRREGSSSRGGNAPSPAKRGRGGVGAVGP